MANVTVKRIGCIDVVYDNVDLGSNGNNSLGNRSQKVKDNEFHMTHFKLISNDSNIVTYVPKKKTTLVVDYGN